MLWTGERMQDLPELAYVNGHVKTSGDLQYKVAPFFHQILGLLCDDLANLTDIDI